MKPLLNWAGGKRWQVPMLRPFFQNDRRLVEPFCGSLAVSLGLEPTQALLNDINPHLINFYRWVQAGVPFTLAMHPEQYHVHRAEFNKLVAAGCGNTLPAAEHFYALNQWCFNGLWRVNKKGEFNVPPRPVLRQMAEFDPNEYQETFNHWMFTCGDFEKLNLVSTDFVYADPPYDGTFDGYDAAGFNFRDQERLVYWLAKHQGPVCMMNAATDRMLQLYTDLGFAWTEIEAPQRMHQSRGRSGKIREVMAFNRQFAIDIRHDAINDEPRT